MGHIALTIPDRIEAIIDYPEWLHSFRRHAKEILNESGHLPETPLWDYLHRRRDLAPARFDHWHPEFRKLFHDEARHHLPVTMPVMPPGLIPIAGTVNQPSPITGTVPEPSGAILLGPAMLILAAWVRWRRK